MDDFILYTRLGLFHVLDLKAYDHILFLTVLAVIYVFSDWKKVLWLITFFTFGHTLTLALSAYDILHVKMSIVEFLIPVTIMATALANIFFSKKLVSKTESNINLVFAFFFGLIHGLGFSSYFKILVDRNEAKLLPLLEFALGIEMAQVVIVILVLLAGFIFQRMFNVNRKDWILVISSVVAGIVIPMLFERVFW
jgi:hypothetical protein